MKPMVFAATKTDIDLAKEHENYKVEFIVEGLIKRNGKNILAAERGTGKTRILLFIAYAIIYGCPEVFGYKISLFGDVLFINLEIAERDFKSFTEPIRRYFEDNLKLTRIHTLKILSFREHDIKLNDIKLIVQDCRPLLTVLDSYKIYQSLVCKEERLREINNSNFEIALKLMDELVSQFNTTIALVNHTNKGTSLLRSNADLMFGPGALPDFVDHVTLLRKTKFSNQRLIVPDKSRFCGEGQVGINLIEICSTDLSSTLPEQLYFQLLEEDVNEDEYLAQKMSNRIDPGRKDEIIQFVINGGTYEKAAETFLGDKNRKGTISKIISKHNRKTEDV